MSDRDEGTGDRSRESRYRSSRGTVVKIPNDRHREGEITTTSGLSLLWRRESFNGLQRYSGPQ